MRSNGKVRNCLYFSHVPSNAVLCRPSTGLYSGSPARATCESIRGAPDGRTIPWASLHPGRDRPKDRLDSWKEIAAYLTVM